MGPIRFQFYVVFPQVGRVPNQSAIFNLWFEAAWHTGTEERCSLMESAVTHFATEARAVFSSLSWKTDPHSCFFIWPLLVPPDLTLGWNPAQDSHFQCAYMTFPFRATLPTPGRTPQGILRGISCCYPMVLCWGWQSLLSPPGSQCWTSLFCLLNQTSPSTGSLFILSILHSYVQDQVSLLSFLPLLTEYEQILFVSSGTTAIVLDVVLN